MAAMAALALPVGLAAHHGTAASYDQNEWITVEGTVTDFYWRNPHSALFLEVAGEDGETYEYGVELASPNLMVRQGHSRNLFKQGDHVVIRVHPSKAGTAVGECLFNCEILVNGAEPEADRQ
jgi:hypothetical protein